MASWLASPGAARRRRGGQGGQDLRCLVVLPPCFWARPAASHCRPSLVAANKSPRPTTMNNTRSAVAAVTTKVKLPDDEAEVAAAEVGAITTAGMVATGGRTLAAPAGLITEVLALPGRGCAITVVAGVETTAGTVAGTVVGVTTGGGVLTGVALAAGVLAAGVGTLTPMVSAAVGSAVMAGLVAASAVAVRVTDVMDVAPAATGI